MVNPISPIRENFDRINERIEKTVDTCGRRREDVRLLVVTKAQPVEVIEAALAAGVRVFGENYPEESLPKIDVSRETPGVEWHMIGHLQRRKARIVAEHFDQMHSVDSVRIARRLERMLQEADRILPVLLEFNVGGEESKFGFPAWDENTWQALLPEVSKLLDLPHLKVTGLMTMPPLFMAAEEARPYFVRLRKLRDYLGEQFPDDNWHDLSMGTSGDFEVALEEGATYVRIGHAVLGERLK